MVVGVAVDDGEGAVDLLDEEETHHLMGEGHLAERKAFATAGIDLVGEAVGASDDEAKATRDDLHLVFDPIGIGPGCELFALFVQEDCFVEVADGFEDHFPFAFLLFIGREGFACFDIGKFDDFDGDEPIDPLEIVGAECGDLLGIGLADKYESYALHGSVSDVYIHGEMVGVAVGIVGAFERAQRIAITATEVLGIEDLGGLLGHAKVSVGSPKETARDDDLIG